MAGNRSVIWVMAEMLERFPAMGKMCARSPAMGSLSRGRTDVAADPAPGVGDELPKAIATTPGRQGLNHGAGLARRPDLHRCLNSSGRAIALGQQDRDRPAQVFPRSQGPISNGIQVLVRKCRSTADDHCKPTSQDPEIPVCRG